MDDKTKELIAIGASVSGHCCQPCLSYHVNKAKELEIGEAEIREAIGVGHMVEKSAMSAMRKFADGVFDGPAQEAPDCCTGTAAVGAKNCYG